MSKRYRLYLINPRFRYKHYAAQQQLAELFGRRKVTVPLALPILAALTPESYDISIIDEESDDIPWRKRLPDLVGITALAPTAPRAFEIADIFRELGVPVVLGGSYVTFSVDEALEHADAVVVGEAEELWPQLLADFERGQLQRTYRAAAPIAYDRAVRPRWDLVDTSRILNVFLQASRGCPYNCEFCLVNKMFGRRMRCRDVDDVIAEIEALPMQRVFFADDNLTLKKRWAKELIGRLVPLGISWYCQSSVDVADDDELLSLMAEAGCNGVLIGFESLDERSLAETRKKQNKVAEYGAAIAKIHSYGIHVLASFVVGFDADTPETLDRIAEFVEENDIANPMLSILAVAPGTDLYERMKAEGRLCATNPQYISGMYPHMHYAQMSQVELLDKFRATIERLLSFDRASERALRLARSGNFARENTGGVTAREKATTFARLVRRFLVFGDAGRRRVFLELMRLMRSQVISPDQMVMLLLTLEANDAYLRQTRQEHLRVRAMIERVDRGPWRGEAS